MKQRYGVYLNYLTTGTLNNHLIEDTETGGGDDGNNRSANDGVTRRDRGTESSESIRVDKENKQYQPVSRRNDIKRPDILINGKIRQ